MAIETKEDVLAGFGIGTIAGILAVTMLILLYVPLIIFAGWTFSTAWNLLMVKAFALPALTIPKAIAIDLLVTWLTYKYIKDDRKWYVILGTGIMSNLTFLLTAYILSFYL